MSYTQVYRSSSARALGAVTVMVCAGALATLLVRWDERELVRYTAPILLIAWLSWSAYWRPHVIVDEKGVTLHNVFRTVHVPWTSVVEIHSRYGLRVDTPQGSYAAWAVAAPAGRERLRGGDTEASAMARQRLERLRGLGEIPADAPAEEPRVTWDVPAVAGAVVLLAGAAAGLVLALAR